MCPVSKPAWGRAQGAWEQTLRSPQLPGPPQSPTHSPPDSWEKSRSGGFPEQRGARGTQCVASVSQPFLASGLCVRGRPAGRYGHHALPGPGALIVGGCPLGGPSPLPFPVEVSHPSGLSSDVRVCLKPKLTQTRWGSAPPSPHPCTHSAGAPAPRAELGAAAPWRLPASLCPTPAPTLQKNSPAPSPFALAVTSRSPGPAGSVQTAPSPPLGSCRPLPLPSAGWWGGGGLWPRSLSGSGPGTWNPDSSPAL